MWSDTTAVAVLGGSNACTGGPCEGGRRYLMGGYVAGFQSHGWQGGGYSEHPVSLELGSQDDLFVVSWSLPLIPTE